MNYLAGGIFLLLFSFGLGLAIEYFAPNKTMAIQLLWAFIPTALLMIYASFVGAILLHKTTDWLFRSNSHDTLD